MGSGLLSEHTPLNGPGGIHPQLVARLRDADAALTSRPRLSIRFRLLVSLALCFGLCCVFALGAAGILRRTRDALRVVDISNRLAVDVEHAVGTRPGSGGVSREDAAEHAAAALETLRAQGHALAVHASLDEVARLTRDLERYRELLAAGDLAVPAAVTELDRLRGSVAAATAALHASQRSAIVSDIATGEKTLALFLILLLALFGFITLFFAGALVSPIRRFQEYTDRIAKGDFTLIPPARPYRDEFTDLALAVNRMLAELQAHQDRCIRAGKLTAVGTLASGVAHELNNPLNNISITAETLMEQLEELDRAQTWELLQDIYFETERAADIVKRLLDFTRDEGTAQTTTEVAELISSTHRLVQNELVINNVTFVSEVPPGLPPVLASANQLRQVMVNLYLNAVQAMPGGGELKVRALAQEGKVCVEVQDQGIGIPADVLPHIFDPFFTTKEPGQGTGLGLSVSWSIVRKFGGDIHVTSSFGRGALFHICLPAAAPAPPDAG